MDIDLFGNKINKLEADIVNIYADETQIVKDIITNEKWIYTVAIYEIVNKPILNDLINSRYRKELSDWENYFDKNDTEIHWKNIEKDNNKRNIIERWLKYIIDDCFSDRKFYFSILGINISNLNTEEFGKKQSFNNIYNRFFRSMLAYSLKKFFNNGVIVKNIYHERGQQSEHEYFDWHTIFKLNQDEKLNFECEKIKFLPKSHREDKKSNIIQLCDVLLGIFKDIHLGVNRDTYSQNKKDILSSNFVNELLINRIIKQPWNKASKYGYFNRSQISLFPKEYFSPDSVLRFKDNYYDISKIDLSYYKSSQLNLSI